MKEKRIMTSFALANTTDIALTHIGLIGVYALAAHTDHRVKFPIEKTMQIANILIWTVQVWNALNIAAELAA